MGCAELWLLQHEPEARPTRKRRFKGICLMSNDYGDTARTQLSGGPKDVVDHRKTGNPMKHFGSAGLHPGALACGKDDDMHIRHA